MRLQHRRRHCHTTHLALIHRLSDRLNSHSSYIDGSTVATVEAPPTTQGLGQEERELTDDVNVDALFHSIGRLSIVGLTEIHAFILSCVSNVSDS